MDDFLKLVNTENIRSCVSIILVSSFLAACAPRNTIQDISIAELRALEQGNKIQTSNQPTKKPTNKTINKKKDFCSIVINPGDSFDGAFDDMKAGDTLCLKDGLYQQAMDIPSNMHVRAVNDGQVEIDGYSKLGEEWSGGLVQMKGSNSSVRGLRVHHAGKNSHTCFMSGTNNAMRVMSCSHAGMHKHKNPVFMTGSGHLLENSWIFGKGRYNVQCFLGRNMVIRGNVARWDTTTLKTLSEPNAAFSIYNCSNMTIENNISLDYGHSEQFMKFGGDFYSPQNPRKWPEGNNNNHYLGNYAINHALGNGNRKGLRFEAEGIAKNNVVRDFYVNGSDFGIVFSKNEKGLIIENCTFKNIIRAKIAGGGKNKRRICSGSAEIGAKYKNRVKVSNKLFPWPNEELIKADLCRSGERQSTWCSTNKSLSDYVQTF
ncbi:MAG: hypothetical protein QM500_07670 [Methylococcales bacterium]